MPLGLDTLNPATLLTTRFRPSQIPALTGRTALVTGGSAGIGYYAALALARAGARVLIVSANPEHGRKAEEELNREAGASGGGVEYHQCEFGDLKQVDRVAKKIASEQDRLGILIDNGGIGQAPFALTKDGLENHYAINNLAHWVLTLRLLPLLRKTAASLPPASVRICMQSSELHRASPTAQFASKEEINEPIDGIRGYGRSKLGLILFAHQLVKRHLLDDKILVTSVHPGTVDTDMQEAWSESYGKLGDLANSLTRMVGKSAEEGAEPCLWATTCSEINAQNMHEYQGNYYQEPYGKPGTESSQAQDEALGDQFWRFCETNAEDILGEKIHWSSSSWGPLRLLRASLPGSRMLSLLWLPAPALAAPSKLRRATHDGVGTSTWVPVLVVVLVLVAIAGALIYRRFRASSSGTRRNVVQTTGGVTAEVTAEQLAGRPGAAATTATAAQTQRRPRRNRRTPSQMSTKSLPAYNKEPQEQELVVYRQVQY
ncbi:NAD(P)-binding protein [Punctularia strigosozonata HHB-11173 SS5]|uniref:NAD(P)-binding protein n=1 Tax=Punctularia strigosozonata (strain HHB-11173) TaxID=741275 RepID=UPI0004416EB5|nr:NAD(P)-binding protein [Punctularia strigosozonata HHB-11173 SS5]EIN14485.1 NAD(P)-binding protein [Punctularia strigosozonata HHB-11173 SS5]